MPGMVAWLKSAIRKREKEIASLRETLEVLSPSRRRSSRPRKDTRTFADALPSALNRAEKTLRRELTRPLRKRRKGALSQTPAAVRMRERRAKAKGAPAPVAPEKLPIPAGMPTVRGDGEPARRGIHSRARRKVAAGADLAARALAEPTIGT